MNRLARSFGIGLVIVASWAIPGAGARAQIYTRPVAPNPPPASITYPPPVPGGHLLQPAWVPPTNYSLSGPSTGTLGYTATTAYYVQPGACGDRLVPTTAIVPVYGYTPGYYRGYYTPLYFRY